MSEDTVLAHWTTPAVQTPQRHPDPWGGGHSSTCGLVPAAPGSSEVSALVEDVATQKAPPATGWRETDEEAGSAATVGPGGGSNCTYPAYGRKTGVHFHTVPASICFVTYFDCPYTCLNHVPLSGF